MDKLKYIKIESPTGILYVAEDGVGICYLTFKNELPESAIEEETVLLSNAKKQLKEYFAKERSSFSLPLSLRGTPFQKSVWEALIGIPYGETRSYGQIAKAIGNPKASRAVGMANNRNPVSIIVPCHRVIGADGALVGYGGGLDKKVFLLELESGKTYS